MSPRAKIIALIAATQAVFFLAPGVHSASTDSPELKRFGSIPSEVISFAQQLFENDWKPRVSVDPEGNGLTKEQDVSTASLGEPFFMLVHRGSSIERYMSSVDTDPLRAGGVEYFVFPIELPGEVDAGTLVVVRNRDEDGRPMVTHDGEYTSAWYSLPGSKLTATLLKFRRESTDKSLVVYLKFMDAGVKDRFLVKTLDGHLLMGASPSSLRPFEIESQAIQEKIRAYRTHGAWQE